MKWQPTPVFLPGKSHGQRSLVGYSPWGGKELDTTEQHYELLKPLNKFELGGHTPNALTFESTPVSFGAQVNLHLKSSESETLDLRIKSVPDSGRGGTLQGAFTSQRDPHLGAPCLTVP